MRTGIRIVLALGSTALAVMLSGSMPGLVSASSAVTTTRSATDSASKEAAEVLAVERRWLKAITAGDTATIKAILAPQYRHITSKGVLIDRDQEIAGTKALPVVFNLSDELIDIVGDTALIRGINTITKDGKTIDRQRFTDVFIKTNGVWKAVAAHETQLGQAKQ